MSDYPQFGSHTNLDNEQQYSGNDQQLELEEQQYDQYGLQQYEPQGFSFPDQSYDYNQQDDHEQYSTDNIMNTFPPLEIEEEKIPETIPQQGFSLDNGEKKKSEKEFSLWDLHWAQLLAIAAVGVVTISTTVPPIIRGISRLVSGQGCNGPACKPNGGNNAQSATPKSADDIVDIEDLATKPTTCSEDGSCACDCPFPLQRHNCKVAEDGTTKYLPIAVDVPTDGSSKWICTCGLSKKFPNCDGSHHTFNTEHGTNVGPYEVNQETCPGKEKVYVCGCGHSKSRKNGSPFCDGSHRNVKPLSIDDVAVAKEEDKEDNTEEVSPPVVADDIQ